MQSPPFTDRGSRAIPNFSFDAGLLGTVWGKRGPGAGGAVLQGPGSWLTHWAWGSTSQPLLLTAGDYDLIPRGRCHQAHEEMGEDCDTEAESLNYPS